MFTRIKLQLEEFKQTIQTALFISYNKQIDYLTHAQSLLENHYKKFIKYNELKILHKNTFVYTMITDYANDRLILKVELSLCKSIVTDIRNFTYSLIYTELPNLREKIEILITLGDKQVHLEDRYTMVYDEFLIIQDICKDLNLSMKPKRKELNY